MVSDEWHFTADRCATPVVFCWAAPGGVGLALATTEVGELGEQAIGFAARDGVATLSLTAPAREYPVSYYGDGTPRPGAHGKPVLFLHPKDFLGTLIELEQV